MGVARARLACGGAVAAAGVVLAAGCGATGFLSWGGKGGSAGSIAGVVVRWPGVDPRSGGGSASAPVPGDPVVARQVGGSARAVAISARDGSFRVSVPVGTYVVVEGICGARERVTVQGGDPVRVRLVVPNAC